MPVAATATVQVTNAVLTSLAIELVSGTNPAPRGTTPTLRAMGTYSDSTVLNLTGTVAWTSSNTAVAANPTPASMMALTVGVPAADVGMTNIKAVATATPMNIEATYSLQVIPGVVASITITAPDMASAAPMANQKIAKLTKSQLRAVARYTDPMTTPDQDVTATAVWTVDPMDAAFASFAANDGIVEALAPNPGTRIHAAFGGQTGLLLLDVTNVNIATITVAPAVAGPYVGGTTRQFVATGRFSDMSEQPLILQATWNSTNAAAATISNAPGSKGLATTQTGLMDRPTTISAFWNGVSGTLPITVTGATLMTIEVTPVGQTIFVGNTTRFTATGIYSDSTRVDLTNDASLGWSFTAGTGNASASSAPAGGYVKGLAAGSGTVVATYSSGMVMVSGSTAVTIVAASVTAVAITAPIDPMSMMPVTAGPIGVGTQMTATATQGGMMVDVTNNATWSTSDATIATVSATGLVTGVAAGGPVTIRAIYGGVGSTTNVMYTVSAAVLTSLEVTPGTASTPKGIGVNFSAIGHYSDNSVVDHTQDVGTTWMANNGVSIGSGGVTGGQTNTAMAMVGATSTITASVTIGGVTKMGTAVLTINPLTLVTITVTKAVVGTISANVMSGRPLTDQFTATGDLSDGTHVPMTTQVTWASSDGNVATVSNASMSEGLVTAKTVIIQSTTTITAIDPVSNKVGMLVETVDP